MFNYYLSNDCFIKQILRNAYVYMFYNNSLIYKNAMDFSTAMIKSYGHWIFRRHSKEVISGRRGRIRKSRRNLEDGGGSVAHTSRASALQ